GVDADGGDLEFAAEGAAVERLDVLQFVAGLQGAGVELVVGEGVENEGVVGVGAVADGDQPVAHGAGASPGQAAVFYRPRRAAREWRRVPGKEPRRPRAVNASPGCSFATFPYNGRG